MEFRSIRHLVLDLEVRISALLGLDFRVWRLASHALAPLMPGIQGNHRGIPRVHRTNSLEGAFYKLPFTMRPHLGKIRLFGLRWAQGHGLQGAAVLTEAGLHITEVSGILAPPGGFSPV